MMMQKGNQCKEPKMKVMAEMARHSQDRNSQDTLFAASIVIVKTFKLLYMKEVFIHEKIHWINHN